MSTKTRENKSVGKIVVFVLLGILVLVAAISGFLLTHYSGLLGDLREEERGNAVSETAEASSGDQIVAPTNIADDVFTILLVGVDSYHDTYTGRSDVQMLMSINQKSKKLVLCSILRDSYVAIPGHGNNRINAAYGEGGTNLLTQTIKNNFGIPSTVSRSSTSKSSRTLSMPSAVSTSICPRKRSRSSTTVRAAISPVPA